MGAQALLLLHSPFCRMLPHDLDVGFCTIYAIGAVIGILAVLLDLGRFVGGYTIGGTAVNRGTWLRIAAHRWLRLSRS